MYILKCADGSYYVGSTTDLSLRVAEHQEGLGGRYTSGRRPVQMVYVCEFSTIQEAYDAERQVKGWRREKKEALIRGDWAALPTLSQAKKAIEQREPPLPELALSPAEGLVEGNGGGRSFRQAQETSAASREE